MELRKWAMWLSGGRVLPAEGSPAAKAQGRSLPGVLEDWQGAWCG